MLLHVSCQYPKGAKESLGQAESSLSAAKHLTKRLPHSNGQRTREKETQEFHSRGSEAMCIILLVPRANKSKRMT